MFFNNLKSAFRSLWKYKSYTFVHIFGLALGITCCTLVYLYVDYEKSFDQDLADLDQLYRVNTIEKSVTGQTYSGSSQWPLAEALRIEAPDFLAVSRSYLAQNSVVKANNELFDEQEILFTDKDFVKIFGIQQVHGDLMTALEGPGRVAVCSSYAKKYFGETNPIGNTIKVEDFLDLEIVAIIPDPKPNTHLKVHMITSEESFDNQMTGGINLDNWGVLLGATATYVKVPLSYNPTNLENIASTVSTKFADEIDNSDYFFQSVADIHLNPKWENGTFEAVSPTILKIFTLIGFFVLVIACINFINLSTAQAVRRAREVSVRKVIGAGRFNLIGQFLGEALLLTFIAGLFGILLTEVTLPYLNDMMKKEIDLNWFWKPQRILMMLGFVLSVGFLSGIYPAILLSRFDPVKVMKTQRTTGGGVLWLRRTLVVTQFAITMILIIGSIVISKQLDFCKNSDMGFDRDALIEVSIPDLGKEEVLKKEWTSSSEISIVSFGLGAPTSSTNLNSDFYLPEWGEDNAKDVALKFADEHYIDTYGLDLLAGRKLTEGDRKRMVEATDEEEYTPPLVVNESFVFAMGLTGPEEAIGERVVLGFGGSDAEVVGVVKDFKTQSFHEKVSPVLIMNYPRFNYIAGVKLTGNNLNDGIAHIQDVWQKQFPNHIFDYTFIDDTIAEQYEAETRSLDLLRTFAGLAILIGCLGLWGLVSFITEQRQKEIGVRKVLGATTSNIVMMLSNEFTRLVFVAFVFAAPLGWYAMSRWLENFNYAISISMSVFVIALFAALTIALLTVSYRSIRAAIANPVDALRSE